MRRVVLLSWVLVLIPSAAHAADALPRTAVAAVGLPVTGAEARKLRSLVRAALKERGGVDLVQPNQETVLFASPPPKSGAKIRERAGALLDRASKRLREFDLADAEQSLASATELLTAQVGLPEARAFDRQRLHIAVSLAHAQRDEERLEALLLEYSTRYPKEAPSGTTWPPDVKNRLEATTHPASQIRIFSDPIGNAFVDGRAVGATPVEVAGLPAGSHRVVVHAAGYFPAQGTVTTSTDSTEDVRLSLRPALSRFLGRRRATLPLEEEHRAELTARAREAEIDLVFLVTPAPAGRIIVAFQETAASAIDGERGRVEVDASEEGARMAVVQLLGKRQEAIVAAKTAVPAWAWLGAGAGAVAVGAGTALRLTAVSRQDDFEGRDGALTQTQAFALRDRADREALSGSLLIGAGSAAIVGVATWIIYDLVKGDEAP